MPNAKAVDATVEFLHESLILDDAAPSGLRWRERSRSHFLGERGEREWKRWNGRYAGKLAGVLGNKGWLVKLTFDGQKRCLKAHRIVFALINGHWPEHDVDHVDRVPGNNKAGNLRAATNAENSQNTGLRSTNTSGVKGVRWDKKDRKWRAEIGVDYRHIYLGLFDTFEHACQARIGAESVLHPFRARPKPLNPATIIPDGALVTGVYSFTGKPKRVTYTYMEAA